VLLAASIVHAALWELFHNDGKSSRDRFCAEGRIAGEV
jgi:hypothetical protein